MSRPGTAPRMGTLVLLLAPLATPMPAIAQETITRTFPFQPGESLELKTARGSIDYRLGAAAGITITVTCEQGKIADYLDLEFYPGNGLRVEGKKVGGDGIVRWLFGGKGSSDARIAFTVEGPSQANLALATAGGDVTLADVEGAVELATSGGDITFGKVIGEVEAATSGGDVRGVHVSRGAELATSGGDIKLEAAEGDLSVATSGGDIEIGNVRGELSAATSGGDIRLGEIEGDASAHTSGGNVDVRRASGELEVATSGGYIRVASAGGDVSLATSGGEITLDEAEGKVEAATSGGDLTVALAAGNDRGGEMSAAGGDLTVMIPSGVGFDLDAEARGGTVVAEVDVVAEGASAKDRLRGTISGGGNLLRLRNDRGDIHIRASAR